MALTVWGNAAAMNLNPALLTQIKASPYYQSLKILESATEVWDEVQRIGMHDVWMLHDVLLVEYLAPIHHGSTPSSAFCLLYRLSQLSPTSRNLKSFLTSSKPLLRGFGLIYLRYTLPPKELLSWFEASLEDEDEVAITPPGPKCVYWSVGKLARELLGELKFQGTVLPRIPVTVMREIEDVLERYRGERKEGDRHSGKSDTRDREDTAYSRKGYVRRRQDGEEGDSPGRRYRYRDERETTSSARKYDEFGREIPPERRSNVGHDEFGREMPSRNDKQARYDEFGREILPERRTGREEHVYRSRRDHDDTRRRSRSPDPYGRVQRGREDPSNIYKY